MGDGSTDKNVAKEADILFAKDYLEEYCIENEIDYIGWKDFYDINEYFFLRIGKKHYRLVELRIYLK